MSGDDTNVLGASRVAGVVLAGVSTLPGSDLGAGERGSRAR